MDKQIRVTALTGCLPPNSSWGGATWKCSDRGSIFLCCCRVPNMTSELILCSRKRQVPSCDEQTLKKNIMLCWRVPACACKTGERCAAVRCLKEISLPLSCQIKYWATDTPEITYVEQPELFSVLPTFDWHEIYSFFPQLGNICWASS